MADERLAQARALIKAKQYQQARRTLTGVDHPAARAWLAKLDEIAPELPEDDPFAEVNTPDPRPAVQPLDTIFDPNPRFDPLPADVARAKAKQRQLILLVALVVVVILVVGGALAFSQYSAFKAEFDVTLTAIIRGIK
ncbi:MAG: hypothetical protein IT324_19570 [Anaerolineae bacterium]|nr:hypothetical protein [Anaerolineae bacterium]